VDGLHDRPGVTLPSIEGDTGDQQAQPGVDGLADLVLVHRVEDGGVEPDEAGPGPLQEGAVEPGGADPHAGRVVTAGGGQDPAEPVLHHGPLVAGEPAPAAGGGELAGQDGGQERLVDLD